MRKLCLQQTIMLVSEIKNNKTLHYLTLLYGPYGTFYFTKVSWTRTEVFFDDAKITSTK